MTISVDRRRALTFALYALAAAGLVAVDRVVKGVAVANKDLLAAYPNAKAGLYIPGVIQTTYVENTGAAFSLFRDGRTFFLILTPIVLAAMLWVFLARWILSPWGEWGLVFVLGGAVGNFIDRVHPGYVVDYLEFLFVDFAIFNFADICVTIGGCLLGVYLLFIHEKRVPRGLVDVDGS